ncbi:response regulator [Rufibacter latericius]|uniref:Response regulator n=1 Tax=Rufibacter latericius TaxID=2487040 RepID=A0A3M9MYN6_9BACT|nr:response regulator [Rufibacter latericius]RNI30661.1 response regulator [Rufibacter latericius]
MKKFKKVLLVENDPVSVYLTSTLLERMDIAEEILVARTGMEAYQLVLDYNKTGCCPDLLLVNIQVPILDGFGLLKALKQLELACTPRTVLFSSSISRKDLDQAKEYQIEDIHHKPLTTRTLNKILAQDSQATSPDK